MCKLWLIVITNKEYALLAKEVLHVALEFLHRIHRTELRWEGAKSTALLIVSLVDLNVSFRPFHLGIKSVFSKPISAFVPSLINAITTRNVQHHRTRWRRARPS